MIQGDDDLSKDCILINYLVPTETEMSHKCVIMASGPITSWQINGETVGTVKDFIFGGSKIAADCMTTAMK